MTPQEAIEILDKKLVASYRNSLFQSKDKIEYEEALEIAIAKMKNSIPAEPLPDGRYYGNGICPSCKAVFMDKDTNYCGNCGQALNWGGTEVRTK